MTKAGTTSLRRALYISPLMLLGGGIPECLNFITFTMVHKGNQHTKAICALAAKMASRILQVLKEDRPYEIRDVDELITKQQARQTIIEKWKVTEEIRHY